jgi:hypothetical protein
MYDGGANKNPLQRKNDTIIMSVNEIRKSFDNRKIDSLFLYQGYLSDMNKSFRYFREKHRKRIQDSVSKKEFIRGIQYNDNRSSGLNMLFKGDKNLLNYVRFGHFKNSSNNKNIIRNYNNRHAIFDKNLFKKHSFNIDTILQQDERFIYKIKITPQKKMVALNIGLKKDYAPIGWLYIYKDNFAFKELSYSLIAITKDSKLGSKIFSNSSNIHYSINLKFIEHQEKMYLNYYSCSFPKMINAGITSKESDRFYYVKQEILFTHFIHDTVVISEYLKKPKNTNLFTKKPYNKQFWKNYTTLLETKEQKKLIEDLEKEVSLKEQFKQN